VRNGHLGSAPGSGAHPERRQGRGLRALAGGLALVAAGLLACTPPQEKAARLAAEAEEAAEAGENREALLLLRQALELTPQDAELNFRVGQAYNSLGARGDARFYYEEAHRLDPSSSQAALATVPFLYGDDPELARSRIEGVLEREPSNAVAYSRLAEVELLGNDTEAALEAALTAVELAPETALPHRTLASVQRARIRQMEAAGEEPGDAPYEGALEAYQEAFEADGNPGDLYARALVYASWPGHEEEVEPAVRRAFEAARKAGDEQAMESLAARSFRVGAETNDVAIMRWALEQQVELQPRNAAAWGRLAELATREEGSAAEVWREAIERTPDAMGLRAGYVRHLIGAGKQEEAIAHLESLPPELTESPGAGALLVETFLGIGQPDRARELLERLRARHPEHTLTQMAIARLDLEEGRTNEAVERLRSLAGREDRADVHRMLARAERAAGNPRRALQALEQAIGQEPRPERAVLQARIDLQARLRDWQGVVATAREMNRRGMALGRGERLHLARSLYETGRERAGRVVLVRLQKEPDPPLQAVLMEARYEADNDPERVRWILEKAQEDHPGSLAVVQALAALDFGEGRPEAALERLDAVAAKGSSPPRLRILRARILASMDRMEEAEKDARSAYEATPRLPASPGVLATILESQDRVQAAIAVLEEARGSEPGLRAVDLWQLGRLHLSKGSLERSRAALGESVEANPDLMVAANDLAYVLADLGEDLDRALALASSARAARDEDPAVADTLGWVYYRRGLPGPALEQFREAIELAGPEAAPAEYHYHLGLALRELGRPEEAREAFDAALAAEPEHAGARQALRELAAAPSGRGS